MSLFDQYRRLPNITTLLQLFANTALPVLHHGRWTRAHVSAPFIRRPCIHLHSSGSARNVVTAVALIAGTARFSRALLKPPSAKFLKLNCFRQKRFNSLKNSAQQSALSLQVRQRPDLIDFPSARRFKFPALPVAFCRPRFPCISFFFPLAKTG